MENNNGLLTMMMSMADKNELKTMKESLEDSSKRISDSAKHSVAMKDAYGNSLLDIGNNNEAEKFSNYSFTNDTLNWPLWLALYNENWVFKRVIDKPSQDEIRCGITLLGTYDKSKVLRQLNLYKDNLIELRMWSRLFGGSIACMMFDTFNDDDYKLPLSSNIEKIKKAKTMKLYVVDRWYGVSPSYDITVSDMSNTDYGKPKFYEITMADGKTYKYHHDYVIRSEGRTAPKLIKNGMLQGWGYSEGAHIFNELMRDDKLKSSVQSLINKSLIEVIKMSGMRGVFMGADKQNEDQLRKRLEMVNWGRNFNSLTFLDKDDEYTMNTFSGLSGLSDILQQNMWQIAAAVEMQGILFGDLKNGFSVDTNALERYDEVIQGYCESNVRAIYEKLLKVIFIMDGINEKIDFTFNSLLMKQHQDEQMENLSKFIDLTDKLINDGVFTTKQAAKAIQNYTNKGIIDLAITDEMIDKLDENFANEIEGLDLSKSTNE